MMEVKSSIVDNMNLQLFSEPAAEPGVSDLSTEELIENVVEIPEVDSNNPESLEDFAEGEEGGGGADAPPAPATPAADDPYAFIKNNTPYNDPESIVSGYKEIQGFAATETERANKLQQELNDLRAGKASAPAAPAANIVDEFGEPKPPVMTPEQINKTIAQKVAEGIAAQSAETQEVQSAAAEKLKGDQQYNEALGLEGWAENSEKVRGIINQYPMIVNNESVANPYKLGLEMAKDPNLMRIYNQYPELLESQGGGLRVAKEMSGKLPQQTPEQISQNEDLVAKKAKDEETKRQAELTGAAVGEGAVGGDGKGEKAVKDMTKDEVFARVGHVEDIE